MASGSHITNQTTSATDTTLNAAIGRFPWPEDVKLIFLPEERELLPDKARRIAFQVYLKLASLSYTDCPMINADYMSPSGKSPFLLIKFVTRSSLSETTSQSIIFHDIFQLVTFLESQGLALGKDLDKREKAECDIFVSLFKTHLLPVMEYKTWINPTSIKSTMDKYSYGLPRPLRYIVPCLHYLKYCWTNYDMYCTREDSMVDLFRTACTALSTKLARNERYYFSSPSLLDALLYGCVEAILSMPDTTLYNTLQDYDNLKNFSKHASLIQRTGLEFIASPSTANLLTLSEQ